MYSSQIMMINIADLPVGALAVIIGFGIANEFTERLQELGLTVGTKIKIIRRAPFKGPFEISYGHSSRLAVRPNENTAIYVRQVE
ncbi:MAG: ferrous iron transport protein A [Ignavibacteria bacterium]|nr:ferrous iron transport protein A [Ignavibacteria bacterium]